MLRRLTVFVRRGLFGVGVGVLLWIPPSWWLVAFFDCAQLFDGTVLVSHRGSIEVWAWEQDDGKWFRESSAGLVPAREFSGHVAVSEASVLPSFTRVHSGPMVSSYFAIDLQAHTISILALPLWLLAAICLAWPVTSFFLARRRKGRGFAVEPARVEAEA